MQTEGKKYYEEILKVRTRDTRKTIISKINDGEPEHFKFAELMEFTEGDKERCQIVKGSGLEVHSLERLAKLKDAIENVLIKFGYYDTETKNECSDYSPELYDAADEIDKAEESKYDDLTAKELIALCVGRGIKVTLKKKKSYYIEKLKSYDDDATPDEWPDDSGDNDDWE